MPRYDHLSQEELVRLLEARDRRDATRFGLVWEANEIERERALNRDFVALDLVPELSCGPAPWRNLIVEGDNFDALRHLRMAFAPGHRRDAGDTLRNPLVAGTASRPSSIILSSAMSPGAVGHRVPPSGMIRSV